MSRYLYGEAANIIEPRELNREINEPQSYTGSFECQIIVTDIPTNSIIHEIVVNVRSMKQRRWLSDVITWCITHNKSFMIFNLTDIHVR